MLWIVPGEENSIKNFLYSQFKSEDIFPNSFNYSNEYQNNLFFNENEEIGKNEKEIEFISNIFKNKSNNIDVDEFDINKSTNELSRILFTEPINIRMEGKKYFDIIKVKKKEETMKKKKNKEYKNLGRKKKNSSSEPSKHDKRSDDNITNKIITNFINSFRDSINKRLSNFLKSKYKKKLLQKIAPINKIYKTIDEIKIFFTKTLGEIFSAEISDRCTTFKDNKNFNKKLIDDLRKNSDAVEINDILNQTVQEMYEKYISNTIPEFNLDNDIKKIETKEDDEDFITLYRKKALNLIKNLKEKKGRQTKSNLI